MQISRLGVLQGKTLQPGNSGILAAVLSAVHKLYYFELVGKEEGYICLRTAEF